MEDEKNKAQVHPEKELVRFPASNRNVIRVLDTTYQGLRLVNIREWYYNVDGQLLPSKNGFALSVNKARALHKALEEFLAGEHRADPT